MELLINFSTDEDKNNMISTFVNIDTNNTGLINQDELKIAMKNIEIDITDNEINKIMKEINNNGIINYSEFLIATLDTHSINRNRLTAIFHH